MAECITRGVTTIRRNKKWPEQWRDLGRQRYEEGVKLRDIAKEVTLNSGRRCPVDTVAGWVGMRGNRTEHWDLKWPARAVELSQENVRTTNIALIIEIESGRRCDRQTVVYWLNRFKISSQSVPAQHQNLR